MSTTLSTIRAFVREQGHIVDGDTLFTDDVDLLDYGYIDSFGIVALIEMINSRFGVDLDNFDFFETGNRTISAIAAATDARSGQKG